MIGVVALLSVDLQGTAAFPRSETASDARGRAEHGPWAQFSGRSHDIRFAPVTRTPGITHERVYQVLRDRQGLPMLHNFGGTGPAR